MFKIRIPINGTAFVPAFLGSLSPGDAVVMDFSCLDDVTPAYEPTTDPFAREVADHRRFQEVRARQGRAYSLGV